MRILVDADACPVRREILEVATAAGIPVIQVADSNHNIAGEWVVTVDPGKDSADLRLINLAQPGDLVITQDYGVAALALGKGAFAMDPQGMRYTPDNMDLLLFQRSLGQKIRRAGGRTPGVKKRRKDANEIFRKELERYLEEIRLASEKKWKE